MRNPTPGKNPFELGSYIDRFPLVFQWLYIDLNRDFFKLKGRTGVSRFWAMYIFSFIFLGIVYWICEKLATTVIVYFSLLLIGWLYVAIPCVSIGVRRLHDMGKPGFLSVFPQFGTFFMTICVAFQEIPALPITLSVVAMSVIPLIFMSLPGEKKANKYGNPCNDSVDVLKELN